MRKRTWIACSLVFSMVLTGPALLAKQVKKTTLKTKKINLQVGKKKAITLKNKKKGAKYSYRLSRKNVVSVSSKGIVKGKKPGIVKVTVKESYKKKTRTLGKVTVICVAKNNSTKSQTTPTPTPFGAASQGATASPVVTPTEAATSTATPTPTKAPSPTPTATPYGPAGYEVPVNFDKTDKTVTYGTKKAISYFSTTTNKDRKANVILPPNYTTEKKYPVLYMLHGIGGDENEWLTGKPQYIIGNMIAQGQAKEMILVIPNCRARENDAASNEFSLEHYAAFDNFINDLKGSLMPYIKENFSIAEGRENTAIAGYSMGGRESLNIGLHMPETFGYIAAFSPGYGVFAYEANGVAEPGLFTDETLTLPEEYKNNTLIMINNGTSESGDIAKRCDKAFTNHNIPHIYYATAGGHEMKVWKHGLYNFAKGIFQ